MSFFFGTSIFSWLPFSSLFSWLLSSPLCLSIACPASHLSLCHIPSSTLLACAHLFLYLRAANHRTHQLCTLLLLYSTLWTNTGTQQEGKAETPGRGPIKSTRVRTRCFLMKLVLCAWICSYVRVRVGLTCKCMYACACIPKISEKRVLLQVRVPVF